MTKRNYWLDLFTGVTWNEFIEAGASVSGFSEKRWASVKNMKPGDYLLCYLTGVSRFIGILEVIDKPYQDNTIIWQDSLFPSRVKVKPVVTLTPDTAIPVKHLKDKLSIFENLTAPHAWTGHFRGSPTKWNAADGEAVYQALKEASENPVSRPVDPKALSYRPKLLRAKNIGSVVIPESPIDESEPVTTKELSDHTQIQHLLYRLGRDMGLHIWIARNDHGRGIEGKRFADMDRVLSELPAIGLDEPTTRTIEHIDVLWLEKNNIIAAFEIESTTSIYSGLLRMADLVAMQPNTNIPLYLVAPDERREKVMNEVNRPTFSKLEPPLSELCRYIPFSGLREQISKHADIMPMLKPIDFLEYLSETCDIKEG